MKIGIAGPVLPGPVLPSGPAPPAGARYATCSSVGADGTRRPACAARAAVHGPAHRTALLAVSTPPSADRTVTSRPSSATDVTRNPVLTGGAHALVHGGQPGPERQLRDRVQDDPAGLGLEVVP